MKRNLLLIAALTVGSLCAIADSHAQGRRQAPPVTPDAPTYGPGTYTENGFTVHVPRQCYVSREQVLQNGQLIWRPLVTCPFDDYR